jgi:hypothetical protein
MLWHYQALLRLTQSHVFLLHDSVWSNLASYLSYGSLTAGKLADSSRFTPSDAMWAKLYPQNSGERLRRFAGIVSSLRFTDVRCYYLVS